MRIISRIVGAWGLLGMMILANGSAVLAQESQVDSAFSDTVIRTLGYPEVTVSVDRDGVEAPAELPAGPHLITLSAGEDLIGYLNIMQPPPGLSEEEATALALGAGRDDLVQPDWVYAGGTNTPNPGETASFVVDLQPGEYQWAASSYAADNSLEEIMYLAPLTVTAAAATPAASVPLPEAGVTLEMTDELRYLVGPNPAPAGPQIWELTNSGLHHAHHVVMVRVPDGVTRADIVGEFQAMMGGTPPAGDSVMTQAVWVGYAALQSGGQTTWAEFDLEPATYAVICFIIDPATGRPHVIDGMVEVFTVA